MKVFSCRFLTACLLLATQTAGANTIGEHDDAHVPRRLSVSPEQSIATEIETAHAWASQSLASPFTPTR